jgi:anti-sigma regulatory factor (Ser/Thr protein kinase)
MLRLEPGPRSEGTTSELNADLSAPRESRRLLLRALTDHPTLDDALLVVSELVTNAVEHTLSGRPGGTVTVTTAATAAQVYIEVTDDGPRADAPSVPALVDPLVWAEHGRGLHLVARCSSHWGVDHHSDGRTTVWSVLQGTG